MTIPHDPAYASSAAATPAPGVTFAPTLRKHCSSAAKHVEHRPGPAVVAHQADAPDLALEVAQPAADLDAEVVEQPLAHRQIIDAGGNADGVELRQLMSFLGRVLEAERRSGRP